MESALRGPKSRSILRMCVRASSTFQGRDDQKPALASTHMVDVECENEWADVAHRTVTML